VSELRIEIQAGEAPPAAVEIRTRVFIEEQQVSPQDELDGLDPDCIHFVAYRGAQAVGCARLRPLGGARAKVERVAVLSAQRKSGLGRALMNALEAEAAARGLHDLVLHAQLPVVDFYDGLGWQGIGPEFDEAGIRHREMRRQLR
jgi:predicted GNAT family N-acyltransferase